MANLRTQYGRAQSAQMEGNESTSTKLEIALAEITKQREEITRLRGDVADGILKHLSLEKKAVELTSANSTQADDLRKAQRRADDLAREVDEERKQREQLQAELKSGADPLQRLTAELDEKRAALDTANHAVMIPTLPLHQLLLF
jgi:chromosome segregation ATPase